MISVKRIQAVVIKDYRDLLKNAYMLSTAVIPLFFALLLNQEGEVQTAAVFMPITLTMVIVGSFIQAAVIAEEKEKNTLRGLLLSPLNTVEIFIGKSVISAVASLIMIVAVVLIGNIPLPDQMLLTTAAMVISLTIFISIGTILGLVSRTVMETSVIGIPVLFIFGMGDIFQTMIEAEWLIDAMGYLPDQQIGQLLLQLNNGQAVGDHILVLSIWAVASVIVTIYIYKKRRFD
ncbi:ABC transporter permease [Halobacillus sp. A1]|uniref:ABC transporter permease n=1 Tax=Halobacillus sp. A1 TaxID=2880262 RepID=UPI0020A6A5FC|nr:ABC transporter permease [Halobacillus sp. A1]MCP3032352.1 ABC transporter permease [Halobacillus sp. A1]